MAANDLKTETSRVLGGIKGSLKALIQKLGGTVSDTATLDTYPTIIANLALNLAAKAHAATHKTGGSDALAPADIGAAAASHTHTKANITDFPASMTPSAHKASHKTGGSDALTPADIGAAAASHTHTKANITDFPASMTPSAHKASHKTGGSDALTPADIGAAAASHSHNYLPITGGTLTGNLTGQYITGTWLQTTAVGDKAGNFATIDNDGWVYYRTPAEVVTDLDLPNNTSIRATTSVYGITRLSNSTTSTSTSLAATPRAVKNALDAAKAYTDAAITGAINSAY